MRNDREQPRGIDDGVDLVDLFEGVWRQKILIGLSSISLAVFASIYAFMTPAVYEARAYLQLPTQSDISALNYGRGGVSDLAVVTVKDVYDTFIKNLQSESLRKEFFSRFYLPSLSQSEREGARDQLYSRFQNAVLVEPASKDNPTRMVVKVQSRDADIGGGLVAHYVEMAGMFGATEVVQNVESEARVKAKNLRQEISGLRESMRKQREDQIARLAEALRIAKSIGLERPPIIANTLSSELSAAMDGSLMYMRGSSALEAEIENLRARNSDDPFILGLREREEAAGFYGSVEIDLTDVKVFLQDGAIEAPKKSIGPKRLLIIVLGLVAGCVLGFGVACLRSFRWALMARARG